VEQSYFIGIDLHRTVIQICVLDTQGEIIAEKRLRYSRLDEGLGAVRFLEPFGPASRITVEAMGLNRWFVNACLERKWNVLVCDPRRLGLKKLGKKTDRRDAYELARRLWLGDLDRMARTYYPSDGEYSQRKRLRVRHHLVQMRQDTINQVRAMLAAYQIPAPRGVLYTGPSREALRCCPLPTAEMQQAFEALLAVLEHLQEQIASLSREIRKLPKTSADVAVLVDELPGIGAQSAATLLYELGDPKRFANPRAVAAYVGLVPRVAQSADKAHHGRLTRQGNRELRWILSQWAVRLLTTDSLVQQWARAMRRRMHKNKVRMALARRLLVGVWAMQTRGEAFDLRRCLGMA
jgi:transposase